MFFQDLLKEVSYEISFGGEYLWSCYGPSEIFDVSEVTSVVIAADCSDPKLRKVREITIGDATSGLAYRWRDPSYIKANNKEAKKRGIDNRLAYDNIKWTEVKTEDEILELLSSYVPAQKTVAANSKGNIMTTKENFTVKFDQRYVLEVKASSMDEARQLADEWMRSLSRRWNSDNRIIFVDNYTVKETVEKELE